MARNATALLSLNMTDLLPSTVWNAAAATVAATAPSLTGDSGAAQTVYTWLGLLAGPYETGDSAVKDNWQLLVERLGMSELVIFVLGTLFVHSAVFWGWNGFLYHCYRNNWFAEYKIQGATLPSGQLYLDCLHHCFVNHFVVGPLTLYFGFPFLKATGMVVTGPIPPPVIFIRDIVVCVLVNDTLFYWGHLLLHHKSIYKVRTPTG